MVQKEHLLPTNRDKHPKKRGHTLRDLNRDKVYYHTKSNRTQVICRLGLMLLPDVGQAMSEIYRVLKPGGRAAAIVQTTPDKSPWLSVPAMIALKHAQLPPPQPGQPARPIRPSEFHCRNAFGWSNSFLSSAARASPLAAAAYSVRSTYPIELATRRTSDGL
jgi:SAM-dependent methyltransferase